MLGRHLNFERLSIPNETAPVCMGNTSKTLYICTCIFNFLFTAGWDVIVGHMSERGRKREQQHEYQQPEHNQNK